MAADAGEKTEAPTPRRRNEARRRGQVARSQDLTAAVLLLAAFLTVYLLGPGLWQRLLTAMQLGLSPETPGSLIDALPFVGVIAQGVGKQLVLILVVMFLVTLGIAYAQVGPLLTSQPLMPSLSKINPLGGIKRLFSWQSLMTALMNVGKLALVSLVGYWAIRGGLAAIVCAFTLGYRDLIWLGAALTFRLGIALSAAFLILALLDYAWQRYRHERDLRMTKEEVKDELRSMEGDPALKRRRRQVQMQMAMQRLQKDVPTADVVVTNPTHLAVAIRYDSETMIAPKVVAKGADQVALRIRQIAQRLGIPIVERRPLARALFETVEVGQYIPERLYRAIAEILAYVYELTGRSVSEARRVAGGARN